MPKPTLFEDFVHRSRAIHGDRYDYTQAGPVWVDTKHKIPILCPLHGPFAQLPNNHLKGSGCPRCGRERTTAVLRTTPAEIVARVRERYPHYDLDPLSYRRQDLPATWRCALHHRSFRCSFVYLWYGGVRGCPACREGAAVGQRTAARRDPEVAANLCRVTAALGPEAAEVYRRWLAGATLTTIGRDQGLTREGVRQRLLRVQGLISIPL